MQCAERPGLAPTTQDEIPELTRLMGATFDADARAAGGVAEADLACYHCTDFFLRWPPGCQDADHFTLRLDGAIAGAAVVWRYPQQVEVLGLLFVVPGRHGQGLGTWIWHALEARYPDARRWMVSAPGWASRTLRFYERVCGFRAESRAGAYVSYVKETLDHGA